MKMRMGMRRIAIRIIIVACGSALVTGCSNGSAQKANAPESAGPRAAAAKPKLGIRPSGDETIHPDLTKVSDELKTVYHYIDDHIDDHVENLQKWIRQPSISNSGEGIPESAEDR